MGFLTRDFDAATQRQIFQEKAAACDHICRFSPPSFSTSEQFRVIVLVRAASFSNRRRPFSRCRSAVPFASPGCQRPTALQLTLTIEFVPPVFSQPAPFPPPDPCCSPPFRSVRCPTEQTFSFRTISLFAPLNQTPMGKERAALSLLPFRAASLRRSFRRRAAFQSAVPARTAHESLS